MRTVPGDRCQPRRATDQRRPARRSGPEGWYGPSADDAAEDAFWLGYYSALEVVSRPRPSATRSRDRDPRTPVTWPAPRRPGDPGTVSPADAIDGVVTLYDLSRSNPVTAVALHGDARFVVKQRGIRVDDVEPLTAERHVYGGWRPWPRRDRPAAARASLVTIWSSSRRSTVRRVSITWSSRGRATLRQPTRRSGPDWGDCPRRAPAPHRRTRAWSRATVDPRPRDTGAPVIVPATEAVTAIRNRLLERSGVADTLASSPVPGRAERSFTAT